MNREKTNIPDWDMDSQSKICPRCEAEADLLGHSLRADKQKRVSEFYIFEFMCGNCGLFYEQVNWNTQRGNYEVEE
jgi:hypothetical protein